MKKLPLLCLLALVSGSLPAMADHHGDCYPPPIAGPVNSLTRACYGHYEQAPRCGTWYSTDGYDEDRVIAYVPYIRVIASSGDSSTCAEPEPCTTWQTRATAYTSPFYAGGPVIGAVRLQSAQYDAALETEPQASPCSHEPSCTAVVAADNDDAGLDDEVPLQLPACQSLSETDKPTPGTPGTTLPEDLCVGAGAVMACYEQETLYDPYGNCDGRTDELWLTTGNQPIRALITFTCYEYGDFWTGPCWIRSRTVEVTGGGATLGIQRSFSDNCRSPVFNPGSGSCSTRVWFEDSLTGYSHERELPTTPSAQCLDLAYD